MTDVFEPLVALEAYFAGEIEPDDAQRLRAWIEADPTRLAEVAERAKIHGYLSLTGVRSLTENVMLSTLEFQSQIGIARRRRASDARRRWLTFCGAALAIGLVAVAAFYLFPDEERVATVVAADNLVWKSKPLKAGEPVGIGEIQIESGRLTISMASTADVTITGATRLEMVDATNVRLHQGVANVHCPPTALGFTVAISGNAKVVDLGTDFDVEVADDGAARVTVNEGRVEVHAPGEAVIDVTAGNQVSVAIAGEQRIGAVALVNRAHAWKRQLKQLAKDKRTFLLLPLNGDANPVVPVTPANTTGMLTPSVDRFGIADGALHFDGQDSFAVYPLTWPNGDFTLSAWVRAAEPGGGRYIIAAEADDGELASRRLRLIQNVVKGDAFVHRLHRVFVNDVRARGGSGRISPERWTHVVVTFRRGPRVEAQMKIYIDGQLTSDNRYEYREGEDPIAADITLGNSPLSSAPERIFHGDLDDVLLQTKMLSDDEVFALYEASRPESHAPAANKR